MKLRFRLAIPNVPKYSAVQYTKPLNITLNLIPTLALTITLCVSQTLTFGTVAFCNSRPTQKLLETAIPRSSYGSADARSQSKRIMAWAVDHQMGHHQPTMTAGKGRGVCHIKRQRPSKTRSAASLQDDSGSITWNSEE